MNNLNVKPPKLAQHFLLWFLKDSLAEEVLGDLEEKFYANVANGSSMKAKLNYWIQILNYLRPFAVKNYRSNSILIIMYKHNIKLTYRNFIRHKSQFLINVTGLSTGLACVLLIYLWVNDELQVDRFHHNTKDLYQLMSHHTDASGINTWKGVPGLIKDEIESSIPDVKHVVATTDVHEYTLSINDDFIKANGKFGSEAFFDVFNFPLLQGNKKDILANKDGIVITKTLAQKLFKDEDAMGKDITWHFWDKVKTVTVIGIMDNLPDQMSESFDFLMSWEYYHDDLISYKNWFNYYGRVMVVLDDRVSQEEVGIKIDQIFKEKQGGDKENVTLFLANYGEKYLHGKYENGQQVGGRIEYVHLFSIVALFILLIACINFINLSTAKATHRTKEISVKKSLGAPRISLINQYLTESISLTVISILVAIVLVILFLPQFNTIAQKQLALNLNSEILIAIGALILLVGVLAGSYPALYLSGFDPISLLNKKIKRKGGEIRGRQTLVVIQFTLSIILIVSVIVVYKQMEFVKNKNLGFDKENLVYFEREGALLQNSESFINELKNTAGVKDAAASGFMVGGANSTGGVSWEGKTPEDQIQFWEMDAGYGLIEMMDMEVVAGRTFSKEFIADSASVIFNETAIAAMGMEDPIGKTIRHYTGEKTIVGVVKDFNLISLHSKVEPMVFIFDPGSTHFIMAKIGKGQETNALEGMADLYHKHNPGYVFKPQFIDQDFDALYKSEQRVSVLSRYFSGLAILISCLGLFGLAAFTAERRTKEIGIRKILGADIFSIVYLLTQDFTKMVLVAVFIALPISYFVASEWLANFAFRIDLAWWYFATAGIVAVFIAWITVSLQTVKAASVNPVTCLKDD